MNKKMAEKIVYGIHPVLEALKSERPILNKILVTGSRPGEPLRELLLQARQKGIPVHIHPRAELSRLARTEHHQGVVAWRAKDLYTSWEDLLHSIRGESGRAQVLILDGIEDPQNLGSLIRTAEACGVKGVIIPKDRAVGLTPVVAKASAGAAVHIPLVQVTNLAHTLEDLKKEGFWIVGADAREGKSLYEMKFDMNVGLVIGGEGKGIRPLILSKCDFRIRIPLKGKVSSLNAAVSGAVILFEILRQQVTPATISTS